MFRQLLLFAPLPTSLHWYGRKHHFVVPLQADLAEVLPEHLLQFLSFFFLATFAITFLLLLRFFFGNGLTA